MAIRKASGGLEDLVMGMGTETQLRQGREWQITQINAGNIPYSETLSITEKMNLLDSKNAQFNYHITNFNNPHATSWEDTGAAPLEHTHPAEDIDGLDDFMQNHEHDARYYRKDEHITVGTSPAADAGKPIVLNNAGVVDMTLLDITTFVFVGEFTPTLSIEYPIPSIPSGEFWLIANLGDGVDYVYTTGSLAGKAVHDGNYIAYADKNEWVIMSGDPNSAVYYTLDGTRSITAPFAGGGHKISNIDDGVADTDGTTVKQVNDLVDASVTLGSYGARRNNN